MLIYYVHVCSTTDCGVSRHNWSLIIGFPLERSLQKSSIYHHQLFLVSEALCESKDCSSCLRLINHIQNLQHQTSSMFAAAVYGLESSLQIETLLCSAADVSLETHQNEPNCISAVFSVVYLPLSAACASAPEPGPAASSAGRRPADAGFLTSPVCPEGPPLVSPETPDCS